MSIGSGNLTSGSPWVSVGWVQQRRRPARPAVGYAKNEAVMAARAASSKGALHSDHCSDDIRSRLGRSRATHRDLCGCPGCRHRPAVAPIDPMRYEEPMSFRYRNAPLVEAVFEFAPEGAALSADARSRVLSLFADYRGKVENIRPLGAQVDLSKQEVTPLEGPDRVRQWNDSGTRMVQAGEDLCAFNALRPYTAFDDYVGDMERLVSAYAAAVGTERLMFLGQRYINQIAIPDEDPSQYFNVVPTRGRNRPFALQMEMATLERGGNAMMTLAYQGLTEGKHQYLLDLYARVGGTAGIAFKSAEMISWQRAAHLAIEKAFEEPLTDKCRRMLGREEI